MSAARCGIAAPELLAGDPDRLMANGPGVATVACGEPAIGLASFACVHEHVEHVRVCGACGVELQRAAGLLVCEWCEDGPEPHECLPRITITWFDGSPVTVVQEVPR